MYLVFMNANTKKRIAGLSDSLFDGIVISAVGRDSNVRIAGTVISASGNEIAVSFENGRFEPVIRRFRRDTGTQKGGDLRLDFAPVL